MKINLHIEKLIVDGLPVESRHGSLIQSALAAELTQRLAGGDLSPELLTGPALSHLPTVSIQFAPDSTPTQLGQSIAGAVHGSISKDRPMRGRRKGGIQKTRTSKEATRFGHSSRCDRPSGRRADLNCSADLNDVLELKG